MPKFVIDEDIPRSTAEVLRELRYEVQDVRDCGLRGAGDDEVFEFAQNQQAVLITGDLGFGNILHFPIGEHFGIIVVHFPTEMSTREINHHLVHRIKELKPSDYRGNLIVIEPGRIRIRRKS